MKKEQLLRFLQKVDNSFPVPLSKKVHLLEYADKLISLSDIYAEIKDGKILSAVIGYNKNVENKIAYISIVATVKEAQGKGLAKGLIKRFIEDCKNKGMVCVHLYTHTTNNIAIKMYRDMGFVDYEVENELRPDDVHLVYWIKE